DLPLHEAAPRGDGAFLPASPGFLLLLGLLHAHQEQDGNCQPDQAGNERAAAAQADQKAQHRENQDDHPQFKGSIQPEPQPLDAGDQHQDTVDAGNQGSNHQDSSHRHTGHGAAQASGSHADQQRSQQGQQSSQAADGTQHNVQNTHYLQQNRNLL